jgi:glycosyltransferase involved in cell wall biosynthesis
LNQTYKNIEIIFWDNCSEDSTSEVVKQYSDLRLNYYLASNHTSLGEARNLAMEKATGEYIIFLDVDDSWTPNCIETFVKYALEYPDAGIIYSKFVNDDGKTKWMSTKDDKLRIVSEEEFISKYKVGMSAVMFKGKFVLEKYIRFNKSFSLIEDYDFFIRIRSLSNAIYIPTPLMTYSIHDSNLSKSLKWSSEFDRLYLLIKEKSMGYELLFPYLRCIKYRRDYYKVKELVSVRKKLSAFIFSLSLIFRDYRYVRLLLMVIIGSKTSLGIRKCLYK